MADDIWSRYGSSLPMGASPSDMIVGETEWGAPVYQSRLGAQYYEPLVAEQPRGSMIGGLASAFADDPLGTIGSGIGSLASGVWDAVSAPARAWRGEPVATADAFNTAGVAQLGSFGATAPAGALRSGMSRDWLPYSDRLDAPPTPTAEQMQQFGRTEAVPVEMLRATNGSQWGRFESGDHPPALIPGYTDRPVAVMMNNGEYLIYDGHHRSALGVQSGLGAIDMDVINAMDYAPYAAGRSRKAEDGFSSSDDELLMLLMGE